MRIGRSVGSPTTGHLIGGMQVEESSYLRIVPSCANVRRAVHVPSGVLEWQSASVVTETSQVPSSVRCAGPAWRTNRVCLSGSVPPGAAVLAAAVATVTVLATLRGDPSLGGISTEVGLDEVSVTHRLWRPRPDCLCSSARMAG